MLERDGFVDRVQCKTGRLRKGAVVFNVCSSYAHHRSPLVEKRSYHGEIDLFAVYCPETAGVYLVPITHLPVQHRGALRVDPPKNNQFDPDPPRCRLRGRPGLYRRTSRVFWCVTILRFTRCSALSIVFVSHSSFSAMSS